MGNKKTWNFKTVPIPEYLKDEYEYPLFKPGHTTSTLLVCMFIGFAIGFLACHTLYSRSDSTLRNKLEVFND